MFNSTVIEVAIGLILIYLVLGLICTSINEYIAQVIGLRAENLREAIYSMFPGPDRYRIADDIYSDPAIWSLARKINDVCKDPSSIPPDVFSGVLTKLLRKDDARDEDEQYDLETISVVEPFLDAAEEDLHLEQAKNLSEAKAAATALNPNPEPMPIKDDLFERARPAIEVWYSQTLDRANGWYKRRAQVMSFMVAFALALVVNADTLSIVDRLSASPVERAQLVQYGEQLGKSGIAQLPNGLTGSALNFFGWTARNSRDGHPYPTPAQWPAKFMGICITAFAASLGAPFWFDVLSKFMMVRSGGDPPKKPDGTASATATATAGAKP